jgi:hypothetical protein
MNGRDVDSVHLYSPAHEEMPFATPFAGALKMCVEHRVAPYRRARGTACSGLPWADNGGCKNHGY